MEAEGNFYVATAVDGNGLSVRYNTVSPGDPDRCEELMQLPTYITTIPKRQKMKDQRRLYVCVCVYLCARVAE